MKGQAIFQLLTILQEETDENNRFTQQMLLERMQERFGTKMNRRTLKVYLESLDEAGFTLCSTKKQRVNPDGTTETVQTDWYLEPQFEPGELRMLTDLLSAMPSLPDSQRDTLIKKLTAHASPTFRKSAAKSGIIYLHTPAAKQLLYTVEILCEAVTKNCTVQFQYGNYVLNQENQPILQPRKRSDGSAREYLVSPYEIVISHGKYYLVCCKEPHRSISHYRIDRIMNIRLNEEFERLPLADTTEGDTDFEHPKMLAEQLYMYSGSPVTCEFQADRAIIGDVIDWFGESAAFEPAKEPELVHVTVQTQPTALHHWALQYGDRVTVTAPESLRATIQSTVSRLSNAYK